MAGIAREREREMRDRRKDIEMNKELIKGMRMRDEHGQ